MSVPHPKGRNIVWTYVKDNIIEEKEDYKSIGIRGFDYNLFEEVEGRWIREVLDRYLYLKHLIKLCSEDWVKQMTNTNLAVGEKNRIDNYGRKKWLVFHFTMYLFWKFNV